MKRLLLAACILIAAATLSTGAGAQGPIPEGLTRIFNGRDLTGWHISRTTHHGATGSYTVKDGVLFMQQLPFGQGGLLMTDKSYKDFDLYLELNPDAGFNSGIFLRSTEAANDSWLSKPHCPSGPTIPATTKSATASAQQANATRSVARSGSLRTRTSIGTRVP